MRLLLLIISCGTLSLGAQSSIDVRFDEPLIYLGDIREDNGIVAVDVHYTNRGSSAVWIKETRSSCGCSSLKAPSDTVLSGQRNTLVALYDPTGRPGYFNKSFTVIFTDGTKEVSTHFSLIGTVLDKNFSPDSIRYDVIIDLMHFIVEKGDGKTFSKTPDFNSFVSLATRALIEDTSLYFNFIYQKEKKNKSLTSFKSAMAEKGIELTNAKLKKLELPENDSFPQAIISLVKRNEALLTNKPLFSSGKAIYPEQNLPIYFQYLYSSKMPILDTSLARFREFINQIRVAELQGKKVQFIVKAAASKNLNNSIIHKDNQAVANRRVRETTELLFHYLNNNGIPSNPTEKLLTEFALVEGPEYDYRTHLPKDFNHYQYLIIIPVIETDFAMENVNLTNYQVHFGHREARVDEGSPAFKDFALRLATLIRLQGYATVVLESSSSSSKTMGYWRNDVMSYYRALNAKIELEKLLEKYGVDPLKLIVTHEYLLVQGPKNPKPDTDLSRFQYVKIIPQRLLE